MIEKVFKKLHTEIKNSEYTKIEKKWWNGHAYFPLYYYILKYEYLKGKVIIQYKFLQSEFTKPTMINSGAFSDRHQCEINVALEIAKTTSNFEILASNFFKRIFNKKTLNFKVKCNDENLKLKLETNENLSKLYKIVENSPEFSPEIYGKTTNNGKDYKIVINYSTQLMNPDIVQLCNLFCKDIIDSIV